MKIIVLYFNIGCGNLKTIAMRLRLPILPIGDRKWGLRTAWPISHRVTVAVLDRTPHSKIPVGPLLHALDTLVAPV